MGLRVSLCTHSASGWCTIFCLIHSGPGGRVEWSSKMQTVRCTKVSSCTCNLTLSNFLPPVVQPMLLPILNT